MLEYYVHIFLDTIFIFYLYIEFSASSSGACVPSFGLPCLLCHSHISFFALTFMTTNSVYGVKLWNTLPGEIKNCTSVNIFKKCLKKHFLSHY